MKKLYNSIAICLIGVFFGTCQMLEKDKKDNKGALLALAVLATPVSAANTVQNVKADSSVAKSVTLTWDDFPGAVVYNVYYTCSTSTQASSVPADTTVTDPTVVSTTTGLITSNGTTTGTEACSSTVVNIYKKADKSPLTIPVTKLGLPYKFIVTAVTGGPAETAASAVASLSEVIPTQAQRLRGIYIVGGQSSSYSSQVAAVDLYDPDKSTWYPGITTLPTPVSFAGIASEKSKIVVAGGFDSGGNVSGKTQVYDVLTDSWSNKTAGNPSSRANTGVASFNGKIYFLGGTTAAATGLFAANSVTLTDIYDVTNNTWAAGTPFGITGDRSAVQINGVIYNNGGRLTGATFAVTHDGIITGPTPGLTAGAEVVLGAGKSGHSLVGYSSATNGGAMWAIGGITANLTNTSCGVNNLAATSMVPITTVQTLQSPFEATQIWNAGPTLATATAYGGAVVDQRNGNVYYSGGNTSSVAMVNTGVTTFIKSNIVTGAAWTSLTAMPNARWGHSAVIPNQ